MRSITFIFLLCTMASPVLASENCAAGKTLAEGSLTIATGNPAYFPWVIDDKPESGEGFEAAVAYALAEQMGFGNEQVSWVRSSFDEAIQPGAKNFDINLQQFSITEDRDKVVDFSEPYYQSAMAVLSRQTLVDQGVEPSLDSLKELKWGAVSTTTAVPMLQELIAPASSPLLYNDNSDVVAAMQADQIDAALFDLPTALYLSAAVLGDGVILGQFPADRTENPDQFGMLMEQGSALKVCVDEALETLRSDGSLAAIESRWLSESTGVPVIK
ncbi:MAG: ABC transporter substrate-binding protein [Granulosicoccus sp.]|nr:ABC transporter substrate-binding protein [Granulosicoccus sp.]